MTTMDSNKRKVLIYTSLLAAVSAATFSFISYRRRGKQTAGTVDKSKNSNRKAPQQKLSASQTENKVLLEKYREQWSDEQQKLKRLLLEDDDVVWDIDAGPVPNQSQKTSAEEEERQEGINKSKRPLRLVAGVDISFVKGSEDNACAALVVLCLPSMKVVYEAHRRLTMPLPYVSGFLAFREAPVLVELVRELRARRPELEPDLVMVDGSGVLHPGGFGLASHLGVLTGLRTIGIAKKFLNVDGVSKEMVKDRLEVHRKEQRKPKAGPDSMPIKGDSGKIWGAAFCANSSVHNPIYVSVGHKVSLATALAACRACCRHRLPEPVRQADIRSRNVVREWLSANEENGK